MENPLSNVIEEVLKIVNQLKPGLKPTRDLLDCGSGFVAQSAFSFTRDACYWVVILCDDYFAFKEVTPEWVKAYSYVVLLSEQVFVEYDLNHKITAWAVVQEKLCDGEGMAAVKKAVRAV